MHYQWGRKPQKLPLPLGIASPLQKDQSTAISNMPKNVIKITVWFGRYAHGQTDTEMRSLQYFATASTGNVTIVENTETRPFHWKLLYLQGERNAGLWRRCRDTWRSADELTRTGPTSSCAYDARRRRGLQRLQISHELQPTSDKQHTCIHSFTDWIMFCIPHDTK